MPLIQWTREHIPEMKRRHRKRNWSKESTQLNWRMQLLIGVTSKYSTQNLTLVSRGHDLTFAPVANSWTWKSMPQRMQLSKKREMNSLASTRSKQNRGTRQNQTMQKEQSKVSKDSKLCMVRLHINLLMSLIWSHLTCNKIYQSQTFRTMTCFIYNNSGNTILACMIVSVAKDMFMWHEAMAKQGV